MVKVRSDELLFDQNMMVKVSVIIPTYNCASLLPQVIESVLDQTFPDFEIIVIDDGSSDNTYSIIQEYGGRIQFIQIEHTGLPSVVRNRGMKSTQGEYIAFLDSDDRWLSNKLEIQVPLLDNDPQLGLVCGNALLMREGNLIPEHTYFPDPPAFSKTGISSLLDNNFIITSTVLVRRTLIEEIGNFSELPELRALEDYDLWLRLATRAKISYLSDPLAIYNDRVDESIRSENTLLFQLHANMLILERIAQAMRDEKTIFRVPETEISKRKFKYQKSYAKNMWQKSKYIQVLQALGELLIKYPRYTIRGIWRKLAATNRKSSIRFHAQLDETESNPIQSQDGKLRLHLGCGEVYLPGYLNIDYPPDEHTVQVASIADQYGDITQLHYEPGSVQEIRLHHVFEHFSRPTSLRLLIKWYTWLEEGGKIIIETPDFERSVRAFLRKKQSQEFVSLRHIFGSQEARWANHYDGWYQGKFELVLTRLGYKDIQYSFSKWKDLHNITIAAFKHPPYLNQTDQLQAAEELLELSLVDDSPTEKRLLQVWKDELRNHRTSSIT